MINEERMKIQKEALDALREKNFQGIVILPTGTGKSYVLIEALRELYKPGMNVLYTCDSQRLRDTDFNKELDKWGASEYSDLIEKECYASAYKKEGQHYNILLADEGDYGLTPAYSKLFLNNTFDHIVFVSATLERAKRALAIQIAPIVYEKKMKEIEQREVVNKSQFYYVPYLLNEKENARYLKFNERFHHLLNEIQTPTQIKKLRFLTLERLHFLAGLESSAYICKRLIAELEQNAKNKVLIFCNSTEQAGKVSEHSYHGKNQELNKLDEFNSNVVTKLAVCGKVDRGINLDGVNNIIMEFMTRSETKAIQKLGRGKRLKTDEILNVFFLVPYYKQFKMNRWNQYPTVVLKKIQEACRNLGIENAKTYIVK